MRVLKMALDAALIGAGLAGFLAMLAGAAGLISALHGGAP